MSEADGNIWKRLTRVVMVLLVLAGMLVVVVCYFPLIKQNENTRKEIYRLDAKIAKEVETSRQLKISINTLQNDPQAVARLAREKLGYAKPGETVIRFVEPVTNSPAR